MLVFGISLTEEHMQLCRISSIVKCSTCRKINLIFRSNKLVKEGVYLWAKDSELPKQGWEYILNPSVWDGVRWCNYN